MTSKVSILSLLDAYSQVHEKGEKDQKACTWQLTLARRNKSLHGALTNGVLLADDVREDLRAIKVVKTGDCEPSLQDEEEEPKKSAPMQRRFVLADALESKEEEAKEETSKEEAELHSQGMRRRRKGETQTTDEDKINKWSMEQAQDEEKLEEERLRKADPLDFFGALPPQELRKAQQEAQKALAFYVEAANLVAEIQAQLQQANNKK